MTTDDIQTKIMIIAGEPSGDLLGAGLMSALTAQAKYPIAFIGVGGPAMGEQGLSSHFPMSDLSVMGIAEILPRSFLLLRRIRETVALAAREQPDVVVTIDSPGFSFRVAKKLKVRHIPVIHYVAPHVWAWRAGRAAKMHQYLDHLLALLPFEPVYFEPTQLSCAFVGHPVVTRIKARRHEAQPAPFLTDFNLERGNKKLLLLPGSRISEVTRHMPVFGDAWSEIHRRHPHMIAIIPVIDPVAAVVEKNIRNWPGQVVLVRDKARHADAFDVADAALAASGTVILELALSRVPTVACYRTGVVTATLVRKLIKTEFLTIPNLLLEREAIPELLQENCTAERIVIEVNKLLTDPLAAAAQIKDAEEIDRLLGGQAEETPSARAAAEVFGFLNNIEQSTGR